MSTGVVIAIVSGMVVLCAIAMMVAVLVAYAWAMGNAHARLFRDRPVGVARVGGELVVVQRVCPGESVYRAEITRPSTDDLGDDEWLVQATARSGLAPSSISDSVQIPIEAPRSGWTLRGSLPSDEPELWVSKIEDRNGRGFSTTIHPFHPAKISEGEVQSDDETLSLASWLDRDFDCSD